ncbi:putative transcriptional regulator [Inquilinus ginsengisoli]|uniref:Transcriptional regulator n=1 Tax=Inquilinus ginsengisoli TaxID=363840 RepID=A0ABU1JPW6_9PROT|nr:MucR family transcriptional regulator [Inquilinus ginsengisoli]MDR6290656.1 putative transcriptional regulator [Inquilinus ginsengisoli]
MARPSETEILRFTKEIVVAHVSRNTLDSESLLDLIRNVYTTLSGTQGSASDAEFESDAADLNGAAGHGEDLAAALTAATPAEAAAPAAPPVPAVPVEDSVTPDYIVCLEDGRRFKTMKRWLRATYGLTPEQYREKWNLPDDYPLTAPNYTKAKSADAKRQGLGAGRPARASRPARPGRQRAVRPSEKKTKR